MSAPTHSGGTAAEWARQAEEAVADAAAWKERAVRAERTLLNLIGFIDYHELTAGNARFVNHLEGARAVLKRARGAV